MKHKDVETFIDTVSGEPVYPCYDIINDRFDLLSEKDSSLVRSLLTANELMQARGLRSECPYEA